MVERKSFVRLFDSLCNNLLKAKEKKMSDAEVMINLGFSPPSWKVWKQQFINYGEAKPVTNEDNESNQYYVKYQKQEKKWYLESMELTVTNQ